MAYCDDKLNTQATLIRSLSLSQQFPLLINVHIPIFQREVISEWIMFSYLDTPNIIRIIIELGKMTKEIT